MSDVKCLILQQIIVLYLVAEIASRFEFTNVKCTSFDKEFSDFEYCYLKSVNRSYKYLSVKCNMLKTPRFSGYRPLMYNGTVDFYRFLKNPSSSPFVNFWYGIAVNYSNLNHSCPYNHDLRLEKLPVDFVNYQLTEVLPFPEGDYLIESTWMANDIKEVHIKFYGSLF
ncbi:uncharacterized protein LOC6542575 [Drosophila erecta]|uniref:MD-2-related lipid-recognition domain-containing protein n=1 Tax=Drosophila erecta TaxID=7220 RepID=B3N415_DROER|nr:uncharacterized protein LOC6542575 [Drosophila erecta]EDV59909.2 uncharacterized protein Dere_GG23151 [Drosophila erecta]